MSLPLSIFIITKNEEDRLPFTLESIKGLANDVHVIDSGSSDNTVEVAKSFGVNVVFHEWQGYGKQKIFGESLCQCDWILNLDADEALSPNLYNEIHALFEGGKQPSCNAYHIAIKLQGRFAQKPGIFAPSNEPIRLYNKKVAGFKDSTVHDSVILKSAGKVGALKHNVHHRSFRSYAHAVEKINAYTSMQAEDMVKRGKFPSRTRLVLEPFTTFLKAYFLRRYLFLGVDGVVESLIYAFSRTLRLAKVREMQTFEKKSI